MKKNRILLVGLALMLLGTTASADDKTETLTSPDGNIKLEVAVGRQLTLSAFRGDELILDACPLSLQVGNEQFGANPRLSGTKRSTVNEVIRPVVPLKQAQVPNRANQLTLSFKGGIGLDLRAYDNGVAYRFTIKKGKGQTDVVSEGLDLRMPEAFTAHISKTRGFGTSYENPYTHIPMSELKADDEMTYLPVLFETPRGTKVLFSESDVRDYPHMFLQPTGKNGFSARHPKSPEAWQPNGDRGWRITKERPCIARTDATRTLPWRFAVIGTDADIALNQMEVVLGGKCEFGDTSWIKPGKVCWDWWNHWTVWGVDFETGINNDTYKYIIETASKFGVEYILLDEGWNKRVEDPFTNRDDINVQELVDYGREKNVGIILWLSWLTVEQHFDLIPFYAKMGVKGLKIDFMDHSDQWMVNFYERVARECARNVCSSISTGRSSLPAWSSGCQTSSPTKAFADWNRAEAVARTTASGCLSCAMPWGRWTSPQVLWRTHSPMRTVAPATDRWGVAPVPTRWPSTSASRVACRCWPIVPRAICAKPSVRSSSLQYPPHGTRPACSPPVPATTMS